MAYIEEERVESQKRIEEKPQTLHVIIFIVNRVMRKRTGNAGSKGSFLNGSRSYVKTAPRHLERPKIFLPMKKVSPMSEPHQKVPPLVKNQSVPDLPLPDMAIIFTEGSCTRRV